MADTIETADSLGMAQFLADAQAILDATQDIYDDTVALVSSFTTAAQVLESDGNQVIKTVGYAPTSAMFGQTHVLSFTAAQTITLDQVGADGVIMFRDNTSGAGTVGFVAGTATVKGSGTLTGLANDGKEYRALYNHALLTWFLNV